MDEVLLYIAVYTLVGLKYCLRIRDYTGWLLLPVPQTRLNNLTKSYLMAWSNGNRSLLMTAGSDSILSTCHICACQMWTGSQQSKQQWTMMMMMIYEYSQKQKSCQALPEVIVIELHPWQWSIFIYFSQPKHDTRWEWCMGDESHRSIYCTTIHANCTHQL